MMIRNKTFVTIIAFGFVAAKAKNLIVQDQRNNFDLGLKISSQKMKCFDMNEYNEKGLNATDYIKEIQFHKKISYCRVSGIWILYDEDNYEGSASFWMYGYQNLVVIPAEFENKVRSLRFPGAPDDWK